MKYCSTNSSDALEMELIPKQYSIKEDYELRDKRIGTGLNGAVYICVDKKTHKEYALKVRKIKSL